MKFSEFQWIATLPHGQGGAIKRGIGDDAAQISISGDLVISTDSMVEAQHFLANDDPKLIGAKLAAVNLSDMAAMGAKPLAFLFNLHLSPAWMDRVELLRDGLLQELNKFSVPLVGGDTVSSPDGLHLVGTIIGETAGVKSVGRNGAKVGQGIYVTGEGLGGSFPHRHLRVKPRCAWGRFLAEKQIATSMLDISDGLLQDLGHLIDDSGVAAHLDLFNIPIHPDAKNNLDAALGDGEDFELLFTAADADLEKGLLLDFPVYRIGQVVEGSGEIWGRRSLDFAYQAMERQGFCHDQL